MPNHVMNRVSVSGDPQTVKEMLESIQDDEKGFGTIDFNKIIPMPESLNIESGSDTTKGLKVFTDFMQAYTLYGTRADTDPESIPKESEEVFLQNHTDVTPRQWELGKAAYENQSKYGAPTWYEWAINNWGTKWNAYECEPCDMVDDHTELNFWTAWSAPHPILQRLSEQYPDLLFSHEWADEDIGMNCGRLEYSDGCFTGVYLLKGDEAAEFACRLWNIDPENELESPTLEM